MEPGTLLLRNASIGGARADLLIGAGTVRRVGASLPGGADTVVDCAGGALLPGLHDHHCHLLATAAAAQSVPCGPPVTRSRAQLRTRLRKATPHAGWLRGVGYDESVAGELDRADLDDLRADVAVRVQHRSGSLWVVNSAGAQALQLDTATGVDGIERDGTGRATGRLWRLDPWLGARLPPAPAPELHVLSRQLAAFGITGVTDATPDLPERVISSLAAGALDQRVTLLGADTEAIAPPLRCGPRKIVVADHALPTPDELRGQITACRPRAVAVHCVTRVALLLTLAVLADVGTCPGDRIEHAAIAPPEAVAMLARLGLTVVTQPSLVALRGDEYLDRVDADDQALLWPFRSLLDAGVPVGCASDAPYGSLDPWSTIRAAVRRGAPSGRAVAGHERVSARAALAGFLSGPADPGGPARQLRIGADADLVLLDRPLSDQLRNPHRDAVRMTVIRGHIVHDRTR